MKKYLVGFAVLAMALALVALPSSPAGAQGATVSQPAAPSSPGTQATGSGKLKKAAFFADTAQVTNASTGDFVDAFNVIVTLAGVPQCIKIDYSGEVALKSGTDQGVSGGFRALVDGVVMQGHNAFGENFTSPDDAILGRLEIVAFHHWLCGMAPGAHTIQVQFRPGQPTSMVVRGRSLTMNYSK
jgi:hypothetical protein